MTTTFDPAKSLEYGARRDAAILDLAGRFKYVQAEDVAELLHCTPKVARARLLSLHRRGRLQRFALGRNEAYIYGPRRSQKASHSLVVLRCYRALLQSLPMGWRVAAYDPEYEMTAGDKNPVFADALVILDNEMAKRRRVAFLEANLDTGKFDKVEKYNRLVEGRAMRKAWWWRAGVELVVAVATIRSDYIRRKVKEENRHEGIIWVVESVGDPAALWREVMRAKVGENRV